jgi:hypothetical protein
MAVATLTRRRQMSQRFGGCPDSVVAARAPALLQQVRMLHARWNKSYARVASRAVIVGKDVGRGFADGADAVVAAYTGAFRCRVVHAEYGCEVVYRMTQLASIRAQNVRQRFGCGADPATVRVAACAIAGCAFEYPLYVTVLAGEITVRTSELVPCRQVVEAGPLHGTGRGAGIQQGQAGEDETHRCYRSTVSAQVWHFSCWSVAA